MKNNVQLAILLAVALVLFAITLYVLRPAANNLTRVTVAGEAESRVAPDTAVITFAVVTQNNQAVAAQQENARKSEAVRQAVEAVAANVKREIKTSDYSVQPEQDYGGRMPKIIGYTARNSVAVSISDLNQVGTVIDAATRAGANSVEGVQFVLREDSPARGDALALASRQAMAKAEAVANSLGGRIVRVVETHEGGVPIPQTPDNDGYAMSNMGGTIDTRRSTVTTPVAAGSLNVRSQIVLTVEIEVKR